MYYEQLQKNLFARVNCSPEVLDTIAYGISAWELFCQLPKEIKERFKYPTQVDAGYFRKTQKSGADNKEYYHFQGNHSELVEQFGLGDLVRSNETVRRFFEYAQKVFELTEPTIERIADDLGEHYPRVREYQRSHSAQRTIRFLCYDPYDPARESLAHQHFDRGGFTTQWFASHPGLEYLDWDMTWKPLNSTDDSITLIAGYSLEKLTEHQLEKTWHRVAPPSNLLPGVRRTSVVSFNEMPKEYDYDQSIRAQDQTPSYRRSQV